MLTAAVAIVVIAVGANLILENIGYSSQDRTAGSNVRLD